MVKTILITGGAGFIGSHLTEKLIEENVSVIVVDTNLPKKSYFSLENLKKKTIFEKIDVTQKNKLFEIVKKYKPDFIIHLAAQTQVTEAYQNPFHTLQTNIMGTISVLEATRTFPSIKGVIVASSDKAYGKKNSSYKETDPLLGDHPYEVSKSSIDLMSQSYIKTYNLPIIVTRFGNVYGEGDFHFDRIIPGICKAVVKKERLLIRSNGTFVRDYISVNDMVSAYIFLIHNFKKLKGNVYNISSKESLSVLELIAKAQKILKIKIPYKILNSEKNEIPYQHLNTKKITKAGFKTQYTLKKTLTQVFNWYQNYL